MSAPITIKAFLSHQILVLSEFYEVTVIANIGSDMAILDSVPESVKIHSISIERDIRLLADIKALYRLVKYFLAHQFSLVHSVSPKAGLLAAIAGWVARVPIRIHTFTGQVWVTRSGVNRWLLKSIDRMIALFTTNQLVDSFSQREYLVANGVLKKNSAVVLCNGSISGVDIGRFRPSNKLRDAVRLHLNIKQDALVLLFLGRLKVDKGVLDLVNAFSDIYNAHPDSVLVVIGPDEEHMHEKMIKKSGSASIAIKFIPFTDKPEEFMTASDLLVLPSYREGFGTVVIEAAACGIPSIVSRIYGLTDAVIEGETGLMFEAGNKDEICNAANVLLNDMELRKKMGVNALERARSNFSHELVTNELCKYYSKILK